jgi:tetratricopeptide (TPR) repeat protein
VCDITFVETGEDISVAKKSEASKFEKNLRAASYGVEQCIQAADLWRSVGTEDWKAVDWYLEAIKCDDTNIPARLKLADLYNHRLLMHIEALELLEQVLAIFPTHEAALEQTIYTLFELGTIYRSKSADQRETETQSAQIQSALITAELLLSVNPNNVMGHCYRGRCLTLIEQPDLAEAETALTRARTLNPDYALAVYFLGLLRIDEARFYEGVELMKQALAMTKDQALVRFITGDIWRYEEMVATAKRVHNHRGTSVEQQLEVLRSCGVNIKPSIGTEDILGLRHTDRQTLEQEDPFQALIIKLIENEMVENGLSWDLECIEGQGDYVRVFQAVRGIARGELDFEDLEDEVYMDDLESPRTHRVRVEFKLDGKKYKWHPKRDNDWLDPNILNKIGALLIKLQKTQRLVALATKTQCCCLLILDADKVDELVAKTDMELGVLR